MERRATQRSVTGSSASPTSEVEAERRRELHRVLGDSTRDALLSVLSASAEPRTAADLAAEVGLHPNTVRPHLERLRSVGLIRCEIVRQGDVGRPQHHYSAIEAADTSQATADRDALSLLAETMVAMVRSAGVTPNAARDSGTTTGLALAAQTSGDQNSGDQNSGCRERSVTVDRLADDLDRLGFDPVVRDVARDEVEIAFGRCPFGALATDAPDIVCSIHEGLLDGFAQGAGPAEILNFVGPSPETECKVLVKVCDTHTDTHTMDTTPAHGDDTRRTQ